MKLYLSFLLPVYHSFVLTHTVSFLFLCPSLFFLFLQFERTTAVGTSLPTRTIVQEVTLVPVSSGQKQVCFLSSSKGSSSCSASVLTLMPAASIKPINYRAKKIQFLSNSSFLIGVNRCSPHPEKGWNSVKLAQPVPCVSAPPPAELSHPAGVWDAAVPLESLKFAVQPGPRNKTEEKKKRTLSDQNKRRF